jgi:hypothetical protein
VQFFAVAQCAFGADIADLSRTYRSLQMCVEDGNMPWRAPDARAFAHIQGL